MIFIYGDKEVEYLKSKDKRLSEVIDKIGPIEREVETDLFTSIVYHIIGQLISTKAHATVWKRMKNDLKEINEATILNTSINQLQSYGMTYRKAEYIMNFAEQVDRKEIDLNTLRHKSDADAMKELTSINGIGVWTAEMILLFCLQRPNIFSYGDLAILRGLRIVYHHKKIDKKLFEKYRKRFSPYCSVASLYFWAVAGGKLDELENTD